MIARWIAVGGWLLGLWLCAPMAWAATADELFAQGVGAFKRGHFQDALAAFRQALAAGLDTATLHYNLGVTLYKLGRYAEAQDAFRACARYPAWAALANYNLGLSAYRRDQRTAAAEYFDRAWRLAESEELRTLAITMLERTDAAASRRARATLAIHVGHNDNVTLSADSQTLRTSRESDVFTEAWASATGVWGTANGLRWDASFYALNYADLPDNDITELSLGVAKAAARGQWRTEAGAQWQYVLLDGRGLQQIASLRLEGARDYPNRVDLRLHAQFSAIDALDDDFAFLDGSRQELGAAAARRFDGGRIEAGLALERNDRDDLTTATEFYSYSPTRHGVWLKGGWPLGARWRVEPEGRYYRSRYADADRRAGGLSATREDRQGSLTLRAAYRLTAAWRLVGEYTYLNNDSNFSEFSYSQRVFLVGVTRPL